MPPGLSVVIPAHNDGSRLDETLERVLAYLRRRDEPWELVVVDDGSTDRTREVALEYCDRGVFVLELALHRGPGAALRHGVVATSRDKVLLVEVDLPTPIEEVERLEPRLAEADLVVGRRDPASEEVEGSRWAPRRLLAGFPRGAARLLGFRDCRDPHSGFKLLRGPVARSLFPDLTTHGAAYGVELVWRARRRGHGVAEETVAWSDVRGSGRQPLREGVETLQEVLRLRLRRRGLEA